MALARAGGDRFITDGRPHSPLEPRWPPIPRIWSGGTAFVIGGGPSVLEQDVERLRGRNVIAINSSWERVPFAPVMFYADDRWWREFGAKCLNGFGGRILTCRNNSHRRVNRLRNSRGMVRRRQPAISLSKDPGAVPMNRTALVPGINISYHLGASRIVLLGADGKFGEGGRRNHYETAYKFKHRDGCWNSHRNDLSALVMPLQGEGVEVLNASPGSAWDLWPIVSLDDVLSESPTSTSLGCTA